jgi:hypothetical protein
MKSSRRNHLRSLEQMFPNVKYVEEVMKGGMKENGTMRSVGESRRKERKLRGRVIGGKRIGEDTISYYHANNTYAL